MREDSTPTVDDPFVGEVLAGTYRVTRPMGSGGMGAVYEAAHTRLNKRFAIKTLHREIMANEEAYRRFRREAEITSELGHPHIVKVHDFAHTTEGQPYIVMELLAGEELEERLARESTLPLPAVTKLLLEVASGLAAAHAKGIIHRDLKPQNIFLTRYGEREDLPKILDFGISKIKGSASVLTRQDSYMGTPQYMAPEQARGRAAEADARTDVFSLGAIIYRALAGQDAFGGDDIPAILYSICHEEPEPLEKLAPSLPSRAVAVVSRALHKDPAARYESALNFAEEFAGAACTDPTAETITEGSPLTAAAAPGDSPRLGARPEAELTALEAVPSLSPREREGRSPESPDDAVSTAALLPKKRPWPAVAVIAAAVVVVLFLMIHTLRRGAPETGSETEPAVAPKAPAPAGAERVKSAQAAPRASAREERKASASSRPEPQAGKATPATRPAPPTTTNPLARRARPTQTTPKRPATRRPPRRPRASAGEARGTRGPKSKASKQDYGERPMSF